MGLFKNTKPVEPPPSIEQLETEINKLEDLQIVYSSYGDTKSARKAEATSLDLQEIYNKLKYKQDRQNEADQLENE